MNISKQLIIWVLASTLFAGCGADITKEESTSTQTKDESSTTDKQQDKTLWLENFPAALAKAGSENKPILINFTGSDWCGWCIKLKNEVFSESTFKEYANQNLVLLEIDHPKRKQQSRDLKIQNQQLTSQFGVQGFPTIMLLNSKGEIIGKTGYQPGGPKAYIKHLQEIIEKSG